MSTTDTTKRVALDEYTALLLRCERTCLAAQAKGLENDPAIVDAVRKYEERLEDLRRVLIGEEGE